MLINVTPEKCHLYRDRIRQYHQALKSPLTPKTMQRTMAGFLKILNFLKIEKHGEDAASGLINVGDFYFTCHLSYQQQLNSVKITLKQCHPSTTRFMVPHEVKEFSLVTFNPTSNELLLEKELWLSDLRQWEHLAYIFDWLVRILASPDFMMTHNHPITTNTQGEQQ